MAVTPIELTPSVTMVEFVYTSTGFPVYISFDNDPTLIAYTVVPDDAMLSGDNHFI